MLRPRAAKVRKSDPAKLVVVILVIGLLLTVRLPVFTFTDGSAMVAINTPSGQRLSGQILPQTDQYGITFLYPDNESEVQTKLDMSLLYLYTPINQSNEPVLASVDIASNQSFLHRWETSLVAPKVSQIDLQDIQLTQNPQIISARALVFSYAATNQTQTVLYWFDTATFMANLTSQEKHVRISLIAYSRDTDQNTLTTLQFQLVTLGTAIANYWQQIKTSSQVTHIISQYGIILSTVTLLTLCLAIIYYEEETRKQRRESMSTAEKLASYNKEIVEAVQQTKEPATLENVLATLGKTSTQKPTPEQLAQRLRELEKRGLIKSSVTSRNDEPIQTWET